VSGGETKKQVGYIGMITMRPSGTTDSLTPRKNLAVNKPAAFWQAAVDIKIAAQRKL